MTPEQLPGSAVWELPVEEVARRVRSRELPAAEVVEAALARTERVEPLIGAWLEIFAEEARERAAEIDRRIAAGEDPGPLAGVPVALKDNLSLTGHRLTCASRILDGYVAPYTATAVERLLAAGAIPLGRSNMDEFAMGSSCENSAWQVTRNPWDLSTVPGGSSGGPAAAVAAGCVPLSFGSDTGGSIRQPAALSGLVGVKPTYGRVSRCGLVAFASSTDQIGPLARNVRDAALALRVIAGPDPNDATSADLPVDDYLERIEEGIRGLRVGVIRDIDVTRLPADSARNWRDSLACLEQAGAEIVEVPAPSIDAAIAVYYVVAMSEASSNLARFDGVRYGRRAGNLSDSNLADLYVASRSEGFGPEVKRRIMLGTFALSSGYSEAYYGRAQGVRERMRRELGAALERADVLVTPSAPSAAFGIGEKVDDPLSMYLSDIFTTPASLCGLPAVAVPTGLDDRGLPLSLQVMGRAFDESTVFRAARAVEREVAWTVAPTFRGAEVRAQ
jgi:aspartyl-tRNA(Asn)/glutamyl-tRNA(Gln) amidotransferase subunit A